MFAAMYLTSVLFGGMIVLGLCGLVLERQEKRQLCREREEERQLLQEMVQKKAC